MNFMKQFSRIIIIFGVILSIFQLTSAAEPAERESPETVLATFRVKPDQLAAFLKLMPDYWAALRAQDLVVAGPHILLRGVENGKPIVVEIFSWKNHEIPDHVPPAIQSYWKKINGMVEERDGHSGIEFPEMTIINSGHE